MKLAPIGNIDSPSSSSTVSGTIDVRGWALNSSGVVKSEVLVDGKVVGNAQIGISRPDVLKVYPEYQNGSSGYLFKLDTKKLSDGRHTISVRSTGKDGSAGPLQTINFNVENLPMIGVIDEPTAGTVKGSINVRGWFLSGIDITKVDVLVDGRIVGQAQRNLSRPDVLKVYPEYQDSNSGYQFTLNTESLSNGPHSITVRATSLNGTTRQLQNVNVNVQNLINMPTIGVMDEPTAGSTVNGTINVRGWTLSGSGVKKVDVLVDDNIVGQAQIGLSRPDVQKVYPEYQNGNAGFQFALNTLNLSNGIHSITVKATAQNGSTQQLQVVKVNVQNSINMPIIGVMDEPTAGTAVMGTTKVRGWFLAGSGVNKVEVIVDGNTVGQAQYSLSRPDVLKVYPEYHNGNAGYEYSLNTKKLTNGIHTVTVKATAKNGSALQLQNVSINVQNLPGIGFIDSPVAGSTLKGTTNLRGWFLDGSDITKVDVLVDGKIVGQAQYGLSRPDVLKVFPEYQNGNAEYLYALDTTKLSNGTHTITARATALNGSTIQLQDVNVNVQNLINLPVTGVIDTPTAGSLANGSINVSGWVLDGSGVKTVEVLVDDKVVGNAQYGLARKDVLAVYPQYQNGNAGYNYSLNTKNYSNGLHKLTVRSTGKNGKVTVINSFSVNIQNLDSLPTQGNLDSPTAGSTISGSTTIKGWYLDGSGVNKIEILIDDTLVGQADYNLSRTDVQKVYPQYFNSNSGFQFTLDTSKFADGQHKLTVLETGKSGKTNSISINVIISNGNPYLTLDLKKPSNITANDIINFFNSKNQADSPLKLYAQVFIDAQNRYGVNAQYLVAHAIWETGWGGSPLIQYKHNLYGYGAYNSCPFTCGYYFQTVPDSIYRVAYQIRVDYLNESGSYYNGPNLVGMNVRYATDQNWKNGIASLMSSIKPYNSSYYSNTGEVGMSSIAPPPLVRDIPAGQPYPTDTIINFPSDILAGTTITANLRSLPYVSSSTLIGTVDQNTTVHVLGYNTDVEYSPGSTGNYAYHWFRVSVNGQTGWMYGGNLCIPNLLQIVGVTDALNVRTGPSTGYGILSSVGNGAFLRTVTSNGAPVVQNGWYNIYLPNSSATGWVSGDYISQWIN